MHYFTLQLEVKKKSHNTVDVCIPDEPLMDI